MILLDLNNIYIRSNNGNLVQLSNVITISEQSNPPQLYRYNRHVSAYDFSRSSSRDFPRRRLKKLNRIAGEVLTDNL
ncbi:MAG: efflux RND transporter permease subunit [Saprospiraceae bacterium]|nr:efflux RND transporter permease subunit [Saprospiraceae bacterium]